MNFTYKGKPILPTKRSLDELSNINLDLYSIVEILEKGFQIRKRKKNIIKKRKQKRKKIINVLLKDMENYYKLIHVGEFTLSKKFKKSIKGGKNEF